MKTWVAGAAVLLASLPTALAQMGSAIVINQCSHECYLWNTPSADGGASEVNEVLAVGAGSYSQTYTQLTNGNGWSLKLAPTNDQSTVMQFEYTYQGDDTLWYDISYVNGDPFDGDWLLSSNNAGCTPTQNYYRYSTDNANGMQASCSSDVSITVTLCSNSAGAAPAPAAPAAPAAAAPAWSAPPAISAPPVAAAVVPNIFTTFVTQIVTVDYTQLAARATQAAVVRDVHQHHHAGVQHQHHA